MFGWRCWVKIAGFALGLAACSSNAQPASSSAAAAGGQGVAGSNALPSAGTTNNNGMGAPGGGSATGGNVGSSNPANIGGSQPAGMTSGGASPGTGGANHGMGGSSISGSVGGDNSASGGSSLGCSGTPTFGSVTPDELYAELAETPRTFLLINVHTPLNGNIPGTDADIVYTDIAGIESFIGADKSQAVVIYCMTDHMAAIAGPQLVADGYCQVRSLSGGLSAWEAAGYPVDPT
jgi:rhodanese-related sulfurtransferase